MVGSCEGGDGRKIARLAPSLFMVTVENGTWCAKKGATLSEAKKTKKNSHLLHG
jgi:hypothetical protein